jgi:O-antigen ligase/Flp pilus assembly protein TadD
VPGTSPTLLVLLAHAVLSALLFSVFSVEVFEYPKLLLLRATTAALGVAACWEWVRAGGAERGRAAIASVGRDPLFACAAAFLVSGVVSGLHGVSPRRSWLGAEGRFHGVATAAMYAVLFVAARQVAAQHAARATALLWACAAASAGVVAYGALQALGLDPVAWRSVHQFRDQIRPGSTLGNPTFLGSYLAMTAPLLFLLAQRAQRRGRPAAGALLLAAGLGALALLASTLSRGAALAFAFALAASVALLRRSGERRDARRLATGAAAVLLAAIALAATPLGAPVAGRAWERVARIAEPAGEARVELWRAALAAFRERPLLGAGPDTFQVVYPAHQRGAPPGDPDAAPEHAHNGLLELAAGQGLAGLAVLAAGMACGVRAARRALAQSHGGEERALVVAAIAALVGWAVSVQFLYTVLATGSLAALAAGIVAGRAAPQPAAAPGRAEARRCALWIAGAGAAASALFLANALAAPPSGPSPWLAALLVAACIALVAWLSFRVEAEAPAPLAVPRATRAGAQAAQPASPRPGVAFAAGALAALAATEAVRQLGVEAFRADALLRRGRALLTAERPAEAISYLEEARRRAPARPLAWSELGVALHRAAFAPGASRETARRRLRDARQAHERARDLDPADPLPHANRARALADLARLDPAAAHYEDAAAGFADALRRAPHHPRILEDAAKAALLAGRYDECGALARRTLAADPRNAGALALLAGAAMARGDLEEAERRLRAALDADWRGDDAGRRAAWSNLAIVLERAGREGEARAAADAARAPPLGRETAGGGPP